MSARIILGISIPQRNSNAPQAQAILTEYGCNIKTRLGLHDVDEKTCSTSGLLLLETFGEESKVLEMEAKLAALPGIVVKKMVF